MVLDLDRAPAALMRPVAHDVRQVTDPERLGELVAIQARVGGENRNWLGHQLAEELRRTPDRLGVYLAWDEGVPASAAWIRFPPASAFASLWGGATLPGHRGRGLYSALLATRAQEARRRGLRYLTVDAGAMSRPIVERLGFERLAAARGYVWRAPGAASPPEFA